MLSRMGNSAWGFFPEGTKLNLIETAKGDSFEVFDRRIVRSNNEISIALAGQTMAFTDGSSRSQAEVHERGFDEIKTYLAEKLMFLINYSLLPLMTTHGFPVAGYQFRWDDTVEYTAEEWNRIERLLLEYFEVDAKYFTDKYNIPISGVKEVAKTLYDKDFFG